MDYNENNYIQNAIGKAKNGDREGAIILLREVLKTNPRSSKAWYLLSQIVEDPKRKIYCLEKVLEIEPGNTQAAGRLNQLKQPSVPLPELEPVKARAPKDVKNKRKTSLWGVIIVLSIIAIVCFCIGLVSMESTKSSRNVNINYNDPAPSFYTIRNNMNGLTDVQWEQYKKSQVIGKSVINWSGWVEEVKQSSGGNYEVLVDMDSPDEFLSVQDVYFDLPASQAGPLRKDQKITFSGRISSVINVLGSCQVNLDNVEMNP